MGLPVKPDLPQWGTSISPDDITTPDSGVISAGWTKSVSTPTGLIPPKPPYRWDNWFRVGVCNALKYCFDAIDVIYAGQNLTPGTVSIYAGSSDPAGSFICDGRELSRATYLNLFNVISTTYGAGNGTTTFNIPNLKGRVVIGYDASQTDLFDALGNTGGENTHALLTTEMPPHTHPIGMGGTSGSGSPGFSYTNNKSDSFTTGSTGGSGSPASVVPHNNLQPYIVMNYIIKY